MTNMCRILCLGDPHYMKGNEKDTKIMEDEFLRVCDQEKPDIIAVMGDVLDRFGNVYTPVLARALYFLKELSEIATLFIIVGNHDRVNPTDYLSDIHPFIGCQWWKNTYVADTVRQVKVKGFRFCLVPYVPKDRYFEALKDHQIKVNDYDVFFSHQEFKGCKYGTCEDPYSNSRDVWNSSYPLNVNGHIHEYQNLGNLINVGTSYQVNFGEKEKKGVSMFTLTKEGEKATWQEKRIMLNTSLKETHVVSAKKYLAWSVPYKQKVMKKRNIEISLKVKGSKEELAPLKLNVSRKRSLREHFVYVSFVETRVLPDKLKRTQQVVEELGIQVNKLDFSSIFVEVVKSKNDKDLLDLTNNIVMQSK